MRSFFCELPNLVRVWAVVPLADRKPNQIHISIKKLSALKVRIKA